MSVFVNDDDRLGGNPERKKKPNNSSTPWKYAFLILLVVVCIVAIWFMLPSRSPLVSQGEIPLVRADEAPFKMKSQDQSVPGIEHQDKLVYGRLRNDQASPPVEHILPDDSTPLTMDQQYTPPDTDPEAPSLSIEELIGGMGAPKKAE